MGEGRVVGVRGASLGGSMVSVWQGGRGRRPIRGGLVRHLIKLFHDINVFLDCFG